MGSIEGQTCEYGCTIYHIDPNCSYHVMEAKIEKLQDAVNDAYAYLICGPEVGGLQTLEDRTAYAISKLSKVQTDIG